MNQNNSPPFCRIYNQELKCWQPFHSFILYLQGSKEIFRHENTTALSSTLLKKYITHDYIAYFSRVIPSALLKNVQPPRNSQGTSLKESGALLPHEINCILILEDLTLRYNPIIPQDQYILLGFQIANMNFNEANKDLKYVRDVISDMHFHLKYSEQGLVYQIGERVNNMLYKTVKYALCSLAELFNIHPSIPALRKLKDLQKMYHDPTFKEYLDQIVKGPIFRRQLTSIAYKTMINIGLFPSYIELNTMNEVALWIKIKDLLANSSSAPYGTNHHASFCMGNFRYSFVFELGNKEKQKVTINNEDKRGFSFKNRAFQYFRIKFLDFFPMDSWVDKLASVAAKILQFYLDNTNHIIFENNDDGSSLKEYLEYLVDTGGERNEDIEFGRNIAQEFYEKYRTELDENMNDNMFKKMTRVITDAELKGYSNWKNNCQTIVAEILAVLGKQFKNYMEPLINPNQSDKTYKNDQNPQEVENIKLHLIKFGDYFNYKFNYIGPFSLTHRLSCFDNYVDKYTSELINHSNFGTLYERIKNYLKNEQVQKFLDKFEKSIEMYDNEYKNGCLNNINFLKESDSFKDLGINFDDNLELISCLVYLKSNELFGLKREIKLANYCKGKLQQTKVDKQTIDPMSGPAPKVNKKYNEKEIQEMANKIPELYARKYQVMNVLHQLQFYFYNNIRLAFTTKQENKSVVGFGPLIIRKPDYCDGLTTQGKEKILEAQNLEVVLDNEVSHQII